MTLSPRDMVRVFRALSDPTRVEIVRLVATTPRNVTQLTSLVQVSQPKVSRHLKILRDAGLLSDVRRGKWVWYEMARTSKGNPASSLIEVISPILSGRPGSRVSATAASERVHRALGKEPGERLPARDAAESGRLRTRPKPQAAVAAPALPRPVRAQSRDAAPGDRSELEREGAAESRSERGVVASRRHGVELKLSREAHLEWQPGAAVKPGHRVGLKPRRRLGLRPKRESRHTAGPGAEPRPEAKPKPKPRRKPRKKAALPEQRLPQKDIEDFLL